MLLKYGIRDGENNVIDYIIDSIDSVEDSGGKPIFHHDNRTKPRTYFGNVEKNESIVYMYLMNNDFKTIKIYKKG